MKTSVIVLLLCALASVGTARTLLEEACDGHCGPETPPYKVLGHEGATEIREYENATWAISFGRSFFGIDVAAAQATKAVFGYFAGQNSQHLKIPPTIPLITTIAGPPRPPPPHNGSHPHPPHHPHHNDSHPHPPHHNESHPHPPHPHPPPPPRDPLVLAGAFVPLKGDLPKPDNRHVKLVKTNTTKVYVHQFGGFALSWLVKKEIEHLKLDLKDLGIKTCRGKFFVVTYDGPWKLIGRKNEVWWTELPKHNRTHGGPQFPGQFPGEGLPKKPIPSGFEAMDPMILFPEEMPPPPKRPEEGPDGPGFPEDGSGFPEDRPEFPEDRPEFPEEGRERMEFPEDGEDLDFMPKGFMSAEEIMLQSNQQWTTQTAQSVVETA